MEKSVLLVDDSPDEILLAKRAFAKAGLEGVLRVADGSAPAGCDLQDAEGGLPALILLDLQMPGKDGLTMLRELRATPQTVSVPVVVLSSSDEPRDIANAYAAGANSYLRKPVDFDQFVQLVTDVHRYWLVHNTLPPARGGA